MTRTGSDEANRAYYDAFSKGYEQHRDGKDPGGYHDLLDRLESDFVQRFGNGLDVLEVGCGTGLVLERIQRFARSASGVDLSPGMLEKAKARGLNVTLGSATELPFPASSFDVTCSFKVLAHVREIDTAMNEMARVTRPGGMVLAEFYNPLSFRGLAKRLGPAGKIAAGKKESDVYTRFDSPNTIRTDLCPVDCDFVTARGIRITIPTARALRLPGLGKIWQRIDSALADSPLNVFAGFWIAAFRKR
jgi:ubiquinone/menaquinone biosynthesis C-methylase UbiE